MAVLIKLIQAHEQRIEQGRRLAQKHSVTPEQTALMLWAKDNKVAVDAEKQQLQARVKTKVNLNKNGVPVTSTKLIVPTINKTAYSSWLRQAATNSGTFSKYLADAANQATISEAVKKIDRDLQRDNNPPRYMSNDIKTYVKRMFYNGNSGAEIEAYLARPDVSGRLKIGMLDESGKPVEKGTRSSLPLPVPVGVKPIVRTPRRK